MGNLHEATYGRADDEKLTEHDAALLDAQISLLGQIKNSGSYTQAVAYAEAYALISGKLAAKPVDVKKA